MKNSGLLNNRINVLMVGVSSIRIGGMRSVAKQYINDEKYNSKVNLHYISTSTSGSIYKRFLKMLLGYMTIVFTINFFKIDILHIHMAEKGSTFRKGLVVKIGKAFGKKVIIHMHAGPFMTWYNTLCEINKKKVLDIFNASDCIIVLGEYWNKQFKTILPESKLITLYNGVPRVKDVSYSSDNKVISYFGRINRNKGIYELLDAVQLQKESLLIGKYKVVLCGTDEEGCLLSQIKSRDIDDIVEFRGWIEGNEKIEIMRNSVISILPSYFEGLSMTIIEAMSFGIPVITTSISTMPEVVPDEVCLVDVGSAKELGNRIVYFLNNKELLEELSYKGIEKVNKFFTTDRFINNTLNIYESLITEKKS